MRGDLAAGRAEVDEYGIAGLADDDVVGRDVAMQKIRLVNELERVEQRRDDAVELFLARRPAERLQPVLEALALLPVEHHVAGVVGAEVAIDAHDVGVVELGERLRFLNEPVEAPAVVSGAILRARCGLDAAGAGGDVAREVLLDGDEAGKRDLVGEVGDAEAAGAQHPLNAVIAGQLCAAWQRDEIVMAPRDAGTAQLTAEPLQPIVNGDPPRTFCGPQMWRSDER